MDECRPRYATPPTPGRVNLGAEVAAAAKSFGITLMGWQRQVADVATELFPGTHTPCYREVIVTVGRQCGKTALVAAFEVHRALMFGSPQSIAYSAQDGKSARAKLLNDQVPMFTARDAPLRAAITKINRGSGAEGVLFETGSRLFTLNSSEDSGHGLTIDFCAVDECWADADDRREQSLIPAMSTRPEAQVLYVSTAGHEGSAFLKRKVDTGRAAIANNENTGICYMEWSADPDADPADPATWWDCIPALGHTITEDVVRHAFQSMPLDSFRRSYLNQWTTSEERVIPAALWNAACSENVAPDGHLTISLDVNPERSAASVVIGDEKGRVELVKQAAGVGWVVEVVVELAKKWDCDVVLDSYGPAGTLAAEIEAEGIKVHAYTTREMTAACGRLYDAIADKKVHIRRHIALDAASAAARKRTVGDAWLWGRRDVAEDVSPLIAATLAYDKAISGSGGSDIWGFYA